MESEKLRHELLIFLVTALGLTAILFLHGNSKIIERQNFENERIQKINVALNSAPILAKAVSVYDITQKRKIYSKNDDAPLPIASLAKIMTVTVALATHFENDVIAVTLEAIKQAGDSGLLAGEKWKVGDLAKLTLINSSNDGAYLLSNSPGFLERIKEKNLRLGARNTIFLNPTGLDILENEDSPEAGVLASAEEVNNMAIYAMMSHPEIFEVTAMPEITLVSESGFTHNFKNTDVLVEKIPNLLFSKTGFTEIAGGSLTIIFKDKTGDEIAVTLLGSTFTGRFTDMENILQILYN